MEAVRRTFARRGTALPKGDEPEVFQVGFEEKKDAQWRQFLERSKLEGDEFGKVMRRLRVWLLPVVQG